MNAIPYNNKYFRILAAFGATMVILFHDIPFDLPNAFTTLRFYPALVASFLAAVLIIYFVHRVTLVLDNKYPWNINFGDRLVYQMCLGVAVPAAADFCIFFVYFLIAKENIFSNDFIAGDFWYVVFLLSLFNVYYGFHAAFYFWWLRIKTKKKASLNEETEIPGDPTDDELPVPGEPETTEPEVLRIRYKKMELYLMPKDIHFLYRSGNNVRVLTVDKNNYTCHESLNSLEARFQGKGLYRINREVIINEEIVNGYQTGFARDTLQLVIKHKFGYVSHILTDNQLTVTKNYLKIIKANMNALGRTGKNLQDD